jgi:hypothetical protein
MIFDDENILVDSIQKDIDNDLNLIKLVRDQYGTFDHNMTHRILNHMFSEILNDETNPQLKSLIGSYGWVISDIGKYRVTISENPKKKEWPSHLFDIFVIGIPGGLMYCIKFYGRTSKLAKDIKSYMIEKYKLVLSDQGYWFPEQFKQDWISFYNNKSI